MDMRRCESCRAVLARTSRHDRRYCSPACRQSAYERRRGSRPVAVPPAEQSEIERILAQATREERLVALVAHAARTNWRAAAWLLERRFPGRWAKPRTREELRPPPAASPEADFFAEIDELARRRAGRGHPPRRAPRDPEEAHAAKKSRRALGGLESRNATRAERYALGMTEKKAASAKPKPEPKPKPETTPEHRPYTGCGDPRPWKRRRRNR
jgi:hypothetical protein